jgi:hypothetical protein
MITLGGDAELELVDTMDPFSEVRKIGCHAVSCCGMEGSRVLEPNVAGHVGCTHHMFALGGDAELELVDTMDPFSEIRSMCGMLWLERQQGAGNRGLWACWLITLGGDAELKLVDTLDPFSEVRRRSA